MNFDYDAYWLERQETAMATLKDWVTLNSHTPNGKGVNEHGDQVASAFASLGFSDEKVTSGLPGYGDFRFLRRTGKGKAQIMLVSHLDTVFPADEEQANNFQWRTEDGKVYGPGIYDIKGGSLMILLVLEVLQQGFPEFYESMDWLVALNATEEILNHSFGTACLDHAAENCLAALVFEGDRQDGLIPSSHLVTHRNGRAIYQIKASGRGAHAGASHPDGINAIRQLARVIDPIEALTNYSSGLTVNIGRISGGVDFNRVPHEAELIFEMRSPEPEVLEQAKQDIERIVESCQRVTSPDGETSADLELICHQDDPPWQDNEQSRDLAKIWEEAGSDLGIKVTHGGRGGLSDGNFLWHALPTLDGLGPAGGNAHASEWFDTPQIRRPEFLIPDSILPKLKLNVEAIRRLVEV